MMPNIEAIDCANKTIELKNTAANIECDPAPETFMNRSYKNQMDAKAFSVVDHQKLKHIPTMDEIKVVWEHAKRSVELSNSDDKKSVIK